MNGAIRWKWIRKGGGIRWILVGVLGLIPLGTRVCADETTTSARSAAAPTAETTSAPEVPVRSTDNAAKAAAPTTASTTLPVTRVVQPGDGLIINVLDEPDLHKVERKVDAKGRITFHFLGELEVGGKTTSEIEKLIRDGLDKDWIIDPQVSVLVGLYAEQTVTVSGFVNREGPVKLPIDRKMTLVEAISSAGGVNLRGNSSKIELSRRGEIKKYDLRELNRIADAEKQIYVEHGDVISVRQKVF